MTKPNLRQATVVALTLATLAAPSFAFADNSSDITLMQTQLQSLLSQVAALKQQILQAGGSLGGGRGEDQSGDTASSSEQDGRGPGGPMRLCPMPARNLGRGSSGDDVKELQQFLQQNVPGFASTTPTGFFGPQTARAMAEFQMENGIASSTNGAVGPATRGFFGKRCGMQLGVGPASTTPMMGGDRGRGPRPPQGPGQRGGDQGGDN